MQPRSQSLIHCAPPYLDSLAQQNGENIKDQKMQYAVAPCRENHDKALFYFMQDHP